jgi:hypothetical protein
MLLPQCVILFICQKLIFIISRFERHVNTESSFPKKNNGGNDNVGWVMRALEAVRECLFPHIFVKLEKIILGQPPDMVSTVNNKQQSIASFLLIISLQRG